MKLSKILAKLDKETASRVKEVILAQKRNFDLQQILVEGILTRMGLPVNGITIGLLKCFSDKLDGLKMAFPRQPSFTSKYSVDAENLIKITRAIVPQFGQFKGGKTARIVRDLFPEGKFYIHRENGKLVIEVANHRIRRRDFDNIMPKYIKKFGANGFEHHGPRLKIYWDGDLIVTLDAKSQATAALGDSVKEELGQAIKLINYMPNGVAAWVDAHGGDKKLATENSKKLRQAEQLMSEILESMPDAVNYKVVTRSKDGWDTKEFKKGKKDFIEQMKKLGFKYTGDYYSQGTRNLMQGQPRFSGLLGPMYDSGRWIRYENQEAYDELSM